jgi:hypothetical protein
MGGVLLIKNVLRTEILKQHSGIHKPPNEGMMLVTVLGLACLQITS